MYRLFIDEVGHDNLKTRDDQNERYLCLMGVMLEQRDYPPFVSAMRTLKRNVFGTDSLVLHRRELIDKKPPPFDRLKDSAVREQFDQGFLDLIQRARFKAICVHIDKKLHFEKYAVWVHHPYHYCLMAMLERYVMQLETEGDCGDVMAEWRGITPNRKLEAAYIRIHQHGTPNMNAAQFKQRLSSGQMKIRKKEANIAGLQLADVLANPAARQLLCKRNGEEMTAPFGKKVVAILEASKYRRGWSGKIDGFGTKLLP